MARKMPAIGDPLVTSIPAIRLEKAGRLAVFLRPSDSEPDTQSGNRRQHRTETATSLIPTVQMFK